MLRKQRRRRRRQLRHDTASTALRMAAVTTAIAGASMRPWRHQLLLPALAYSLVPGVMTGQQRRAFQTSTRDREGEASDTCTRRYHCLYSNGNDNEKGGDASSSSVDEEEGPDYFADYDDFIKHLEGQLEDDDGESLYADVGEKVEQSMMQPLPPREGEGEGEKSRHEFVKVGAGALNEEDDDQTRKNADGILSNGPDLALATAALVGDGDETVAASADGGDEYGTFLARLERDMKEGRAKELLSREGGRVEFQEEIDSPGDDDGERRRKYHRDRQDNKAKLVDEAAVVEIVELRNKAKKRGDYGLADELRDELITTHGVFIWDKERMWTTNPVPPALRKGGRGASAEQVTLNRHGHDYTQVGDGIDPAKCNIGLQDIHKMLAKLSHFELAKEFNLASSVRSKLIASGVKIENRTKQWRADGGGFKHFDAPNVKIYSQSKYSTPVESGIRSKIESLLRERAEAKKIRDFDRSDDMEEELWETHNVILDHRDRTWTVAAKSYGKSPLSLPLPCPEDEEDVRTLLSDRFRAIRARDYKLASFIKHHLYDAHEITIDDKRMQWSVGGRFENVGDDNETEQTRASSSRPARKYIMRGSPGDLSPKDVALVEALVSKRSLSLASFDQTAADAIREGLLTKFDVHLDDLNQEFCVGPEKYMHSPMQQKNLPLHIEEARDEIERIIQQRAQARSDKDFDKADHIRDKLCSKLGVRLDDRTKEWWYHLEDTPGRIIDEDQEMVKDQLQNGQELTTAGGDEAGADSMTSEFLATLTVPQLKERLREAGLPVSGRKSDLVERLL